MMSYCGQMHCLIVVLCSVQTLLNWLVLRSRQLMSDLARDYSMLSLTSQRHDLTDIRSWFGLVNQVSYTFSIADKMLPFRQLMKTNTSFQWDEPLQSAFEESKEVIITEIEHGVRIFDTSKPTCLATDWSKTGIGFWLLQKHCNCPQTILVGGRFTHALAPAIAHALSRQIQILCPGILLLIINHS